jgi:hypothetical protein
MPRCRIAWFFINLVGGPERRTDSTAKSSAGIALALDSLHSIRLAAVPRNRTCFIRAP